MNYTAEQIENIEKLRSIAGKANDEYEELKFQNDPLKEKEQKNAWHNKLLAEVNLENYIRSISFDI